MAKKGPEKVLEDNWIKYLLIRGWYVKNMHGNMYQSGFPDLFSCHTRYGIRLIEVKLPEMKGSKFTPAQLEDFPKITANGCGIWILTTVCESEYNKLFKPFNWWHYYGLMK